MSIYLSFLTQPQFGKVVTGVSVNIHVNILNSGDETAEISDIVINTSLGYSLTTIPPYSLPAGEELELTLSWTAGAVGVTAASNFEVISNDPASPLTTPVTSESVASGRVINASPASQLFPDTKVGVNSAITVFTISNTGSLSVTVTGVTFPTDWTSGTPIPGYPVTLLAGESLTFGAQFNPVDEGYTNGSITVQSNATAGDLSIAVSGNGFLITPAYSNAYSTTGAEELVFAFSDSSVKVMDPSNFECESPAYCSNTFMLPFQTPEGSVPGFSYEKEAVNVLFHYENLGVATLRVTLTSMRGQVIYQDVTIGTVGADNKLYQGIANIICTDEIHTVTFTEQDGPIQLVDWDVQYVMKGERKK